ALDRRDRAAGIALYELAASSFAEAQLAAGGVVARQNLSGQYRLRGEIDAAEQQVSLLVAAAPRSLHPLLVARAAAVRAAHALSGGGDIGLAHRALLRADRLVPSDPPIGLRRTILLTLATASLHAGDIDGAIDALERHRAARAEDGSAQNAATVEL